MTTNLTAWDDRPVDVSTEVNFIWSIANKLRGPYTSDKYKDVIIPMVVIRRFECALAKKKDQIVAAYRKNPKLPPKILMKQAGFSFYNTSPFTLRELTNDSEHLAANFTSYLEGFSTNVQDILSSLEFDKQIEKMNKHDRLYSVVKAFSELDLAPDSIDNIKMGYIFEDLIRRFSENAEAGDHYTGRDIIKLMVNLLLAEGADDIFDKGKVVTILDQACGTGGMLSTSYNCIHQFNDSADIRLYGQEINPESYAICLSEMLIKGQDAGNIRLQDTMTKDCFAGQTMRFVIENPPFGTAWGGKDAGEGVEAEVKKEAAKADSRFPAGLPGTGDMQLLFVQSAVDKMDDARGRCAIIENGSPLFTGGTASGESQIRRWLLERDLLEAIIALPTDLFYNTGIATYIWILSKNKSAKRKGCVQLIDGSSFCEKLRKSLGNKRNEISPEDRAKVTKLYADFEENAYSKIVRNEDFLYREYTVMQPLQRSYAVNTERIEGLITSGALSSLYDEGKEAALLAKEERTAKEDKQLAAFEKGKSQYDAILETLRANASDTVYKNPQSFRPVLEAILAPLSVDKKLTDKIMDGLSQMDKTADIQKDRKGNILYDKDTKDTEIVPYTESIEAYMAREVLPYVPDAKAFFEEDLSKKKPVIKTGAEIPFTRYFYQYEAPKPSEALKAEFIQLEQSVSKQMETLFGEVRS